MQLVAVVAAMLLAAGVARAQDEAERVAEAAVHVYADDDHVTVITPAGLVRAPLSRDLAVEATVAADVISAASVDITSQASPYAFQDQRLEAAAMLTWRAAPRVAVSARAVVSGENDYLALRAGGGARVELARKNTLVDLAYTASLDQVGRVGDPAFAEPRRGHRAAASFTQLLGEGSAIDLVVDGEVVDGYLENPYRYVPIHDQRGQVLYSLPEEVPGRRAGLAWLARARVAAGGDVFVHGSYRLYGDTWGVLSHTASATALVPLAAGRVQLAAQLRGYFQGAAVFHRALYRDEGGAPAWRTRDRSLGEMRTLSAHLTLDLALAGGARFTAGAGLIRFTWFDYPPQRERDAVLATVAVTAAF